MTSIAKREIGAWAPGLTIDKNGRIWKGHMSIYTVTTQSRFGVSIASVDIGSPESGYKRYDVWKILSQAWYEGAVLLTRTGNMLCFNSDQTIAIKSVTRASTKVISDPDEIQLVWQKYNEGVSCWELAEKTGLIFYTRDEFVSLIKDILVAGIR